MTNGFKCMKCGCEQATRARPIDAMNRGKDRTFELATYRKPNALIFKGRQTVDVQVWVCHDCGFIEFYTENPRGL